MLSFLFFFPLHDRFRFHIIVAASDVCVGQRHRSTNRRGPGQVFWRTENCLAGHFGGLGRGLVVGRAFRMGVAVLVVGRVAAAAALGGVGAGAVALEGSDAGAGGGAGAGQTGHAGSGH